MGNRKAQDESNHCLGSRCTQTTLSPEGSVWESCGHAWASWNSKQGTSGKGHAVSQAMAGVDLQAGHGTPDGLTLVVEDPCLWIIRLCPRYCFLSMIMWDSKEHWTASSTHGFTQRRSTGWTPMVCQVLSQMLRPQNWKVCYLPSQHSLNSGVTNKQTV